MLQYDVEPMENQLLEKVVLECPDSMVEIVFPKLFFMDPGTKTTICRSKNDRSNFELRKVYNQLALVKRHLGGK